MDCVARPSDHMLRLFAAKRHKQRTGKGLKMTKIEVKKPVLNIGGEDLIEEKVVVTVGDILRRACMCPDGQTKEEKMTDDEKCRCWLMTMDITKALKTDPPDAFVEFDAKDVAILLRQLSRAFPQPLIVGQLKPLLK
jgi:hypothetical protein